MLLKPIGGFQEPEEMERYLVEGKCDLFGLARAFMADPEYGKKLYEGRGEDVTPCLKCNKCHGVMLPEPNPWVSVCSVNPLQGLGHKIHRLVEPSAAPKKVAVIGGGPAGMRAAIFAAQRGHDVTLYEKTNQLGGQLFHGDYFPFKWPIQNYKNWLIYELGQSNVKVVMNTEPTAQMITAGGYDAVLAATGATLNIPNIPGLKDEKGQLKPEYFTWADATVAPEKLGKKVVIVGGSEVGTETAMYLCGLGHDVTVLTRQKRIAHNASGLHYITMAFVKAGPNGEAREAPAWEMYDNLTGITQAETVKVEGNTVTYVTPDGTQTITGDSVVICGGMTPQTAQAFAYSGLTTQFYAIGDCNGAGNLEVCNREAYSRAMIL
jgi:NADPH-dependent 2,4-dienoyl-CoA reductase/sulfur reductase-like enzyme